jgi:hypothetical protein
MDCPVRPADVAAALRARGEKADALWAAAADALGVDVAAGGDAHARVMDAVWAREKNDAVRMFARDEGRRRAADHDDDDDDGDGEDGGGGGGGSSSGRGASDALDHARRVQQLTGAGNRGSLAVDRAAVELVARDAELRRRHRPRAAQDELLGRTRDGAARAAATDGLAAEEERMDDQARRQDEISADMLHIVSALKERSSMMRDILKSDNAALSELDSLTEGNLASVNRENRSLDTQLSKGSSNTCFMWLVLAAAILVFFFMVVLMRLV